MSGWHAKLSASGASRWMNCPGAPREIAAYGVNETTKYAAAGTAAHDVAARCLRSNLSPYNLIGEQVEADGFTFKVGEDMADAVDVYVEYCRALTQTEDNTASAWVEHSLTEALVELHPEFGGTADFIMVLPTERTMYVVDYKHGAGVYVSVEGNRQLRYYALGALLSMDKQLNHPIAKVVVSIVQPRCYAEGGVIREEEFAAFELTDFAGELVRAAQETEKPDAPLHSGDHCTFCPAAYDCPELKRATNELVSADFDIVESLSPEQMAQALDLLPAVEARIKAIRSRAYNMAIGGNPPPGWGLYPKRATRKYVDGAELDLANEPAAWDTEPRLKSPAQLEKALGKARYRELCENKEKPLVTKESSGYNIAPIDPNTPALPATIDDFEEVN